MQSAETYKRVEAELSCGLGRAQLVRCRWQRPIDVTAASHEHHLELALLPQADASRAGFPNRWGPDRLERMGNVFLFPAREVVHAQSKCRQQYSIVCTFLPDAVATWFDGTLEWTDSRLQASLDIASPHVRGCLLRLGEELRNPGFASATMIEMMAGQLAIELARYCLGVEEKKISGGLSAWNLKLIDERLAEEGAPPSLSELAKLCSLSVRHLTRAFRISRSRSIGEYMAECRIDQAKRLLSAGACVKTVAYSMGFTSPSNFSASFRRSTGETPREYRQRAARVMVRH